MCEICGKKDCTRSSHSLREYEEFVARMGASAYDGNLPKNTESSKDKLISNLVKAVTLLIEATYPDTIMFHAYKVEEAVQLGNKAITEATGNKK